jgi:hypothetical protein
VDSFNNNFDLHSSLESPTDFLNCYFDFIDSIFFYRSLLLYTIPFAVLLWLQLYMTKLICTYLKNNVNNKYILFHKYLVFMSFTLKLQKKILIYFCLVCLLFDIVIAIFT